MSLRRLGRLHRQWENYGLSTGGIWVGVDRTQPAPSSLVDVWNQEMAEAERRFVRDVVEPMFEHEAETKEPPDGQ